MTTPLDPPIACLQLGLHWFSQRAGGLDRYVAELTRHRPANADVRVLALRASEGDTDVPAFVRFYASADAKAWERRRQLCAAVEVEFAKTRFDVVASHFAQVAHPVRGRSKRRPDVPHVVHFHGPWAAESLREGAGRLSVLAKGYVERAVYSKADLLVCLSQAFADLLIRDYRVDAARVRVIPGGVDARAFNSPLDRAAARERLGWDRSRPTIVCVRRLVRRMGLESLIEAVGIVRRSVPDVMLNICGRGPIAAELAQRIQQSDLSDHVTLRGFVPDADLPAVYRAADLSIVPTESLEGFGLTTLESLAAGTPALVTPVGGLPEAVSGLSQTLVLEGVGTAAIAGGLVGALRGGRPLPGFEACQAYIARSFDWPDVAARVFRAYRGHQL